MHGLVGHPSERTGRIDRIQPKPLRLLRGDGPLLKIGHRGAAALAPANTIEAAEAALVHGADLIELDVLGGSNEKLVLGHSRRELTEKPVGLDEMLAFLVERAPTTGILADVKFAGRERELVETLRAHGLVERAMASSSHVSTLQSLRRLEPALARSRTYPRGRVYLGHHRTFIHVTRPVQWAMRLTLPARIRRLVDEVGASALTLNHRVVSRTTVERCHELGVAVFAWTVNERAVAERLDELGVDGVITDDPRILSR
ncbi:MAG TPA: glycerophosphodiester phosphodiesterase [Gaiellaceae bacterium]|nr:glycerophosphodiester phosphodiesterase [Gaiellaceae bacterium]